MASEQRLLIDKEPIKKFIEDGLNNPDKRVAFGYDAIEILAEIEFAPTVDATILPCKIGDEVWGIRRSNKGALSPHRGIVSHMYFAEDMKLCIVVQHICRGEWGKKVFATYEDACAAIRERREVE